MKKFLAILLVLFFFIPIGYARGQVSAPSSITFESKAKKFYAIVSCTNIYNARYTSNN